VEVKNDDGNASDRNKRTEEQYRWLFRSAGEKPTEQADVRDDSDA
jgi:hypothetical protein